MDGKEKDYRDTGGYVDMGRMEKADDVPTRLSNNEILFTQNAVRKESNRKISKNKLKKS